MRHALTHKFQLSGPTVHSLFCGSAKTFRRNMGNLFSTNEQQRPAAPSRESVLMRYDRKKAREAVQHTKSDFVDPRCLVDNLRPGDMIQVKGNFIIQWFYSHFAVFIGKGEIVHVASSNNWIREKTVIVRARMVDEFDGKLVRKNNHLDNSLVSQPKRQIVLTARSKVGQSWNYNLFTHNCEHFATWCRYGREISLQSFGIGDVVAGRVSFREYVSYSIQSKMEKAETFINWVKRKTLGFICSIA